MIICEMGLCKVKGTPADVIFDFNQIIETLYQNHPEMTTCVLAHWADVASEKIDTLDKKSFTVWSETQDDLIKFLKEHEDEKA